VVDVLAVIDADVLFRHVAHGLRGERDVRLVGDEYEDLTRPGPRVEPPNLGALRKHLVNADIRALLRASRQLLARHVELETQVVRHEVRAVIDRGIRVPIGAQIRDSLTELAFKAH